MIIVVIHEDQGKTIIKITKFEKLFKPIIETKKNLKYYINKKKVNKMYKKMSI